jgi:hypothetical protein
MHALGGILTSPFAWLVMYGAAALDVPGQKSEIGFRHTFQAIKKFYHALVNAKFTSSTHLFFQQWNVRFIDIIEYFGDLIIGITISGENFPTELRVRFS